VKKIISILVALGLVLAMSVVATPAMAATCEGDAPDNCAVNDVTPGTECETATYNISFDAVNSLEGGWDEISVQFPATSNVSLAAVTVNGVAAAAVIVINADTELRITPTQDIDPGDYVELIITGVVNPAAGSYVVVVKTTWDPCPCSAAFTILEGGSISPTSAVWCPGHNITVDIIWGGSTNITGVDGGVYLVDYIVNNVTNKLTILPVYMASLGLATCGIATLNIDFDPGCNVTLSVTVADNATVVLHPGWNLVSLPIIPISEDIEDVLAGVDANICSVWYYDGCDDEWYAYKNGADFGLDTMEAGKAYWVCSNATGDINLSLCGYELPCPPGAPPCYCYCHCWNMVGFHSTTNMTRDAYLANLSPAGSLFGAMTWNASGWQNVNGSTQMLPGQGFWMAFTADQACFAPPV